jgi:putative ABC transport system permease protein
MANDLIPGRVSLGRTIRLAWRNLYRNRRRTWITAVTVGLAVLLLNLSASLLIGIEQQSFDNLIYYQTGHAKLFAEGYFDNREELPLDYAVTEPEEVQARVSSVQGVAATAPRLVFQAQLSNGADQLSCFGVGIQVAGSDTDVFRLPQAVVEGEYLRPGEDGILLGSGMAGVFDVSVGDWLTILAKTKNGAYEAIDFRIVGLLGTGNPLIDVNSVLLPLETAQSMLEMEGEVTEVAVRFAGVGSEEETVRRIEGALASSGAFDVKGWRELESDFMSLVRMKRTGQMVMLTLFLLMAVVGVTNTVLMAAFERTREIGMLMAMGLRGGGIRRLFLAEGALTGLVGGGVGTLVAAVLLAWIASVGLDITAIYGDMDIGYPVRGVIYPSVNGFVLAYSWTLTGVLAAVASLYPAARASRNEPVEALRHV